ncbi:hypothetical protein [Microcoleus sp. BROC3]|uniref:hypothetical protein n=1 Tax=Microcoleus sp. BROC3 TaxID=3055323 RepID=UPI002FD1586E
MEQEVTFKKFVGEMAAIGREPSVIIDIPKATVFSIISTIQLASRHPGARASATAREAIEVARQWQVLMFPVEQFPVAAQLLEDGWNKELDY